MPAPQESSEFLRHIPISASAWNQEVSQAIAKLWADALVQQAYSMVLPHIRYFKNGA